MRLSVYVAVTPQSRPARVPCKVSSSEIDRIPSALTKEYEAVFEANFIVSCGSRHEEYSMVTRSSLGFSGYSIVDGTVSVSTAPYSSVSGIGARPRGTELSGSSVVGKSS
ncbi:MAG: hypothetical protein ACKPKO_58520 [Candidatus Fonsibacter sp.]